MQVTKSYFGRFNINFNSEPLAKAFSRNYKLPERVTNANFSYGNKTAFNDYVAKDVIAPNNIELE